MMLCVWEFCFGGGGFVVVEEVVVLFWGGGSRPVFLNTRAVE